MIKSKLRTISGSAVAALAALGLLAACGEKKADPATSPPAETAPAAAAPAAAKATVADEDLVLPTTCTLLLPEEVQSLTGLAAKRWKKDLLEDESPLLSTCAWKLEGDKPVILSLNVRANPNPAKRTAWARNVLQGLVTKGRTDKQGKKYTYEAVDGLGDLAAWSQSDGQLRWSEGNRLLFTLHTQKVDLLSKDQFLAVARAVSAKVRTP